MARILSKSTAPDMDSIATVLLKHTLEVSTALEHLYDAIQALQTDDTNIIFPKQIDDGVQTSLLEALWDAREHLDAGVQESRRIYHSSTARRVP